MIQNNVQRKEKFTGLGMANVIPNLAKDHVQKVNSLLQIKMDQRYVLVLQMENLDDIIGQVVQVAATNITLKDHVQNLENYFYQVVYVVVILNYPTIMNQLECVISQVRQLRIQTIEKNLLIYLLIYCYFTLLKKHPFIDRWYRPMFTRASFYCNKYSNQ